ncbi:glycosyltransferase [Flavobacterium columnare]|uniref:Glycosyltransferase n=1 Tax=Flavobacterium columnare TaxID=996 RepID=A0AAI8GBC6_9FLAO|nr:glycosyltransferase [Flavobacterium columnare]AMO20351.1 glycosyltransferase [Flavobacterium columnare]AUX18312.1 glycosyltransferase [Flavobacterium columnare]QOG57394.1 glycosyltransferase [Flavobacterium columnare]QOG60118.1 glycosyltransferase [Flavobacterium columnare]QOG62838.1 glycosyltransferase [Flavobacterium columnare]
MRTTKNILVAPLNWGLGHATRCIPIIRALLAHGMNPIIASDGEAFELLKFEFPSLTFISIPSYKIKYAKKGRFFKWKLMQNSHTVLRAIFLERLATKKIIAVYNIQGIISDNRLGIYSKKIPCIYITHQLNVLTGNTTLITSWLHQLVIKQYTSCWVPDFEVDRNLTGDLGHLKKPLTNVLYLGPISRFKNQKLNIQYDLMVVLSGPEPQRSLLEKKLILELKDYNGSVLFVKGNIDKEQKISNEGVFTFYNFMNSEQLEIAFNTSEYIICRSGYTTVMDLAYLGKKAFFIPTPGQYEQIYLAHKLSHEQIIPYCLQDEFSLKKLEQIVNFKGFIPFHNKINWKKYFEVFNLEDK